MIAETIQLQANTPDSVSWRWTANKDFTVASAYAIQFVGGITSDFKELIWNSDATLRCKIFAWLAIQGRCLTADNLTKRGWPCNPICALCHIHPETADHLLGQCSFSKLVWQDIVRHCNCPTTLVLTSISAVPLRTISTTAAASIPASLRRGWNAVVQLVWWQIWKERNERVFRNKASSTQEVVQKIIAEC